MTVLLLGASGSIGRLVVDEALRSGHVVRALARDIAKISDLSERYPEAFRSALASTRRDVRTATPEGTADARRPTLEETGRMLVQASEQG